MSIFDDLNNEFAKSRDRFWQYQNQAVGFTYSFAEKFRNYIGAPEKYTENFDGPKEKKYVEIRKLIPISDDKFRAEECDNKVDCLNIDENGYREFALCVRLERKSNSWPKELFPIYCKFVIENDICYLNITTRSDGRFEVRLTDDSGITKAFDFIRQLLIETLQSKPYERLPENSTIGFLAPTRP